MRGSHFHRSRNLFCPKEWSAYSQGLGSALNLSLGDPNRRTSFQKLGFDFSSVPLQWFA
jgi:hypothetical protein